MKESTLVTQLKKALCVGLPGAVVFKHHDAITAGIPDLSVTWKGTTTWVEVKYNTHQVRPLQHNTMLRLGRQGYAFYVIYRNDSTAGKRRTIISRPSAVGLNTIDDFKNSWYIGYDSSSFSARWNHLDVVAFIRSLHLAVSTGVESKSIPKTTDNTDPGQDIDPGTPAEEE